MVNPLFYLHYPDPRHRVEGVRLLVRIANKPRVLDYTEGMASDVRLLKVCQRKMLYQLFGCNPTTWEEMLATGSEEAGEAADESVGRSGVPAQFVDWSCDYP